MGKIKGKTTIELTDVNTGKVEIYEDNNRVTNGLKNFLNIFGSFASNPLGESGVYNSRISNVLTGGLFLFDKAIPEELTTTFMPAGTKMVGNGAVDMSNSGLVTNWGSYNTSESGVSVDGNTKTVKYVYDFSTQQANGTIACACLTSKAGGYVGMGNVESVDRSTRTSIMNYQTMNGANNKNIALALNQYSYNNYGCLGYAVYNEDAIYMVDPQSVNYATSSYPEQRNQHWSVSEKIKVHKVRAGFKSVGLQDMNILDEIIQTWEIAVPQAILNYMGDTTDYSSVFSDAMNRCIYIVFSKSTTVNTTGTFSVMKIDSEMNVTYYSMGNSTGRTLNGLYSNRYIVFNGDYMYVWAGSSSNYKLCGIKITDSTQVVETCVTKSSASTDICNYASGLIGIYDGSNNYNYYGLSVYDCVNDTLRQTNGYSSSQLDYLVPFADMAGAYIRCYNNNYRAEYSVLKDARYLTTVNNLQEPVTKTSSKTMKVTYSLVYEV